MRRVVFISRNESDTESLVNSLRQNRYEVIAVSLIRTVSIEYAQPIPESEWIFFSSSKAVYHFFDQNPILKNQKFGAIGIGTAKELSGFAVADFIGMSADTQQVAHDFSLVAGKSIVLFASAEDSTRTIQRMLPAEQTIDLICYRTEASPVSVNDADVYVFSSPSNAHSFFTNNKLKTGSSVIAFGHSTASALREYTAVPVRIPHSLSETDLFDAINSAMDS